ncbi:MAG TPA: hypothetical protein VES62_14500 [Thermoleophilaceae bacterium]|nr:hypothetical protein [Thermoleophilaceae bacterium]
MDHEGGCRHYLQSDYFREAGALLFPLMDGAPDSAYYVADRVGP